MIGSGVSTDSMIAASFGIIDSIISTASTASTVLITSTTSSLSATSAFHGGGVGAGVLRGVGARAITMALSTESWDLQLGEQFGPTSATMGMPADLFLPAD